MTKIRTIKLVALAASLLLGAALAPAQTVVGWGWNVTGQINVPSGAYTAIAAGQSHSLAVRADGRTRPHAEICSPSTFEARRFCRIADALLRQSTT